MTASRRTVETIHFPDGIYIEGPRGEFIEVPCQWFAACDRHATSTQQHPVLGAVPICGRCATKIAALKGDDA